MGNPFTLPVIPKEREYEEYIAAFLQAGGLYVERNAIYREDEELLELDIITTHFDRENTEKTLIEIKSGKWSFADVFKVKGWLVYLGFTNGSFVVQETRQKFDYYREKAKYLNIELIDNSDLDKTKDALERFLLFVPASHDIETIRAAFCLERKQMEKLKRWKRANPQRDGVTALDTYYYKVNSESLFFSEDPMSRITSIFRTYQNNRNITAKLSNESAGGNFDDDVDRMCEEDFRQTFYNADDNIYQISLMVEHLTRLAVLKSCIEHLIEKLRGNYNEDDMDDYFRVLALPANIQTGINQIITDEYFHLYPSFWQWFTFVFGGFILLDFEKEEYQLLSEKTGIPNDEIPKAFEAFNKLFPHTGGWFYNSPYSQIKSHRLFPVSLAGIGANYRRILYTEDKSFPSLRPKLTGEMTYKDLIKWNNLAYKILVS